MMTIQQAADKLGGLMNQYVGIFKWPDGTERLVVFLRNSDDVNITEFEGFRVESRRIPRTYNLGE